eukprot:c11505_g1_i1.p1 GENE.c11505_g1_i1~~c11505_g1_i1.p1  ORF type:complete len:296 (+),score=33.30 c11505_g1_i1:94-888(+)
MASHVDILDEVAPCDPATLWCEFVATVNAIDLPSDEIEDHFDVALELHRFRFSSIQYSRATAPNCILSDFAAMKWFTSLPFCKADAEAAGDSSSTALAHLRDILRYAGSATEIKSEAFEALKELSSFARRLTATCHLEARRYGFESAKPARAASTEASEDESEGKSHHESDASPAKQDVRPDVEHEGSRQRKAPHRYGMSPLAVDSETSSAAPIVQMPPPPPHIQPGANGKRPRGASDPEPDDEDEAELAAMPARKKQRRATQQ